MKREVVAEIEIGLNGSEFRFREGESEKTLWECEIYYNYYTETIISYLSCTVTFD